MKIYDLVFVYEVVVIFEEGIWCMYVEDVEEFYYVIVDNENEVQLFMFEYFSYEEICYGIMKGFYCFQFSIFEGVQYYV